MLSRKEYGSGLLNEEWVRHIRQGDTKAIARGISLVENEGPGYEDLLRNLPYVATPVIGITGPPGAGKSSLVDALVGLWVAAGLRVAVLCVDPSSPFNKGALLGDRIRMSQWYLHPQVFIRSLATRGSLGGLHPHILEIIDIIRASGFDRIVIETVGVGQSEVEIAGVADCIILVLVPEAGDEIQVMKAGLMEIADIFVVNKADRPDAQRFVHHLNQWLLPGKNAGADLPVLMTVAVRQEGVTALMDELNLRLDQARANPLKAWLLAKKAWYLIAERKMSKVDEDVLVQQINAALTEGTFNLYRFIEGF